MCVWIRACCGHFRPLNTHGHSRVRAGRGERASDRRPVPNGRRAAKNSRVYSGQLRPSCASLSTGRLRRDSCFIGRENCPRALVALTAERTLRRTANAFNLERRVIGFLRVFSRTGERWHMSGHNGRRTRSVGVGVTITRETRC